MNSASVEPPLYPIFLRLVGAEALVVGGGKVAARKIADLLESGARVTVVAPELSKDAERFAVNAEVVIHRRAYKREDIEGKTLVIAAADFETNRQAAKDARRAGAPVNVVDRPELCDFHAPARVRRGLLQIAISTGGASPALAKRLRVRLAKQFPAAWGELLDALAELRKAAKSAMPDDQKERQRLLEEFIDSGAPELLIEKNDRDAFRAALERWKERLGG